MADMTLKELAEQLATVMRPKEEAEEGKAASLEAVRTAAENVTGALVTFVHGINRPLGDEDMKQLAIMTMVSLRGQDHPQRRAELVALLKVRQKAPAILKATQDLRDKVREKDPKAAFNIYTRLVQLSRRVEGNSNVAISDHAEQLRREMTVQPTQQKRITDLLKKIRKEESVLVKVGDEKMVAPEVEQALAEIEAYVTGGTAPAPVTAGKGKKEKKPKKEKAPSPAEPVKEPADGDEPEVVPEAIQTEEGAPAPTTPAPAATEEAKPQSATLGMEIDDLIGTFGEMDPATDESKKASEK